MMKLDPEPPITPQDTTTDLPLDRMSDNRYYVNQATIMGLFQVSRFGDYWGVFAVNPNNPDDRRLANLCETEGYAEGLALDLNRLAEIVAISPEPEPERLPIRKFHFVVESSEPRRRISFDD
jgi:hypothetical protein